MSFTAFAPTTTDTMPSAVGSTVKVPETGKPFAAKGEPSVDNVVEVIVPFVTLTAAGSKEEATIPLAEAIEIVTCDLVETPFIISSCGLPTVKIPFFIAEVQEAGLLGSHGAGLKEHDSETTPPTAAA